MNLTFNIDKDALAKFKEAKIDDPAARFKGKFVRVEGKVILYRDKPEIKRPGRNHDRRKETAMNSQFHRAGLRPHQFSLRDLLMAATFIAAVGGP
jgi:hypothetical protein